MVDLALLAGRLLLLALLYLFLLATVRAGMGLVTDQRSRRAGVFTLSVTDGPPELKGVAIPVTGPVVIGRSPGADIVIADEFVSGRHARVLPDADGLILEDLESTNGTVLNGQRISRPQPLRPGDHILVGDVRISVDRS